MKLLSHYSKKNLILLFSILLSNPATVLAAHANNKNDTITGAGAHFAWVIFDSLKEELEQSTGKKLQLFGKNSNLGMGCNAGIKLAKQNTESNQTFGFVCCPLSQHELDKEQLIIYPLAEEPVMILLNKTNPVKNLSTEQVRSIFHGDITNWKSVGGLDKPIVVVTRLHCKKRPGHWKTILPNADEFVKERLNVSSAKDMVKLVTDFDTAIGHLGSTWKFGKGSNVKAITINNLEASAENLKNKSYPFHRRLSAVTSRNPTSDVLKTIRQVQRGKSFQQVAERFNLLPLNPDIAAK
jgi:phosphate transport system substrate-binding protein